MELKEIIRKLSVKQIIGNDQVEVTGVAIDSREVSAGYLFMAVQGQSHDGHDFIAAAVNSGAAAILCQRLPKELDAEVCYVLVEDSQEAVGKAATAFYGDPSSQMLLVGVTGTNGKTTIATLLYRLMRRLGYRSGLLSTVCNYVDGEAVPTDHTTPDPITLNRLLGQMAQKGCKYVFMEVSSHALEQRRVSGLRFQGAIFTNLTRDHLDYHGSVENYLRAKKRLFDNLDSKAFALTNLDDKNGMVMVQNTRARIATYSLRSISDFRGKVLESHLEGMLLEMNGRETAVHFMGQFNASNLMAVMGCAMLLGKPEEEVLRNLSDLFPVSGRMDTIHSHHGVTAVVDYAHTPDALANVLDTLRETMRGKGTLITVFGAGGNRDRGKRPLMAQEVARRSDRMVITSDNPRYEEPGEIIRDILSGLRKTDLERTLTVEDRKEAIRTACSLAHQGDVVLVAGKGHEDYQEIKGVKHHFDDKEVLREILGQ